MLTLLLAIVGKTSAEDKFTVEPVVLNPGDTKELAVDLTNKTTYTAFQFDLKLPKGITLSKVQLNDNCKPIDEDDNKTHSISRSQSSDDTGTTYKFICYSSSTTKAFLEASPLMTLTIKADENANPGIFTANFTDVVLSEPDGTKHDGESSAFDVRIKRIVTEPEPYAALEENNSVLTFYYDKEKDERNSFEIGSFTTLSERTWNDYAENITKVVITSDFSQYTGVTSTAFWFRDMKNLEAINGLTNLNVKNVTDMQWMFANCKKIQKLEIGKFDTGNVEDMQYLFFGCESVTSLEINSFNTTNVTKMNNMFGDCKKLVSLDLTKFNTSKVVAFDGMFSGCSSLTDLDLSSFDTKAVTSMGTLSVSKMFALCSNLKTITFGADFDMPKLTTTGHYVFDSQASIEKVTIRRDVPSLPADFFSGIGTADKPVSLIVPTAYRQNYIDKFDSDKLFGGYFSVPKDFNTRKEELQNQLSNDLESVKDMANQIEENLAEVQYRIAAINQEIENQYGTIATYEQTLNEALISDEDRESLISELNNFRDKLNDISLNAEEEYAKAHEDYDKERAILEDIYAEMDDISSALNAATTEEQLDEIEENRINAVEDAIKGLAAEINESGDRNKAATDDTENELKSKKTDIANFKTKMNSVIANTKAVIADDQTREYGEANPTLTYRTQGEIEGTPIVSTLASKITPVGLYNITVSKGTITTEHVRYVDGTLTITKAPLVIATQDYKIKVGDRFPSYALTFEGFKNGESKSVLSVQPTVECEAQDTNTPGRYLIVVNGAESPNYEISYVAGWLTIEGTATDILPAWISNGEAADVYDMNGKKVRTKATSLEGLPKGVYIVNGKKVMNSLPNQ